MRPVRGAPAGVAEIPPCGELVSSPACTATAHWYACGDPTALARQGFKLYVPLTMLNARELIGRLAPLVARHGLAFKYVASIKLLRKLNAGIFGYEQIGKCFVIYLPVADREFLDALIACLTPYRDACPAVPCGLAFGDGLPLYYRYGAYAGTTLELQRRTVDDDRSARERAIPSGVVDELAPYVRPVIEHPAVAAFLRRYPIFRALVQQGKCGVFHAMRLDSATLQEVALKVGYHRGQVQPDGSDGCTLIRHELRFYELLRRRGLAELAPRLVDALDVPGKAIAVLEYVAGADLLVHKIAGRLTVGQLDRAWAVIERFHAAGLYLGDAKLANFLATDDGDLRVVDFEAAGIVGEQPRPIQTFVLDPRSDDPCVADKQHFLASVLYDYDAGRYSWADRHLRVSELLARDPRDEPEAWAIARLRALRACRRRADRRVQAG